MSIDVIGNFLTIIRNGVMVSKPYVVAPYSTINQRIATVLKDEGFIREVSVVDGEGVRKLLKIDLKYVNGESVIHKIDRMSTPSRRVYSGATTVKPVIGGLGISIMTTNAGVMTHRQARKNRVGGEIICTVW